ncbi:MAG: hypothetical protein KBS97_02370 [Firmicutes bacterium]|nr:hypothetical protein [Candidatus Fiminaster equi]
MKKTKLIITVLMLGGLWGLLEATLGTLLHLEAFDSIIFASTAVLFPIAYMICGRAYKITGKARTALYVGIVAASIKALCFFFVPMVNKVVNPMVAIILESGIMAVAFAVTKPEKICSLKSFVTFMVASTLIRSIYVGYSMATAVPFQSAYIADGIVNWSKILEYVVTMNAISFAYCAAYMGIGVGIKALEKRPNFAKFTAKVQHFAYSPVFAAFMVCAAVVSTIFLK